MNAKHPWSIGGGGAAELKDEISAAASSTIGLVAEEVGITSVTGEDDLFIWPEREAIIRRNIEKHRELITGDLIRDWEIDTGAQAAWLYDEDFNLLSLEALPKTAELFWPCRASISRRKRFGTPMLERGLTWYEWQELYDGKLRVPLSITFAEVATHNHFVLDRGGKVFKQTAPVIKLKPDATEEDHLRLLGLLNSSTACFWIKQVFYPKATATGDISTVKGKPEANRYQIAGTGLQNFPIPDIANNDVQELASLTSELDKLTSELSSYSGCALTTKWQNEGGELATLIEAGQHSVVRIKRRMVYLQEELDWLVYRLYGLIDQSFLADANATISKEDRPYLWASDSAPASLAPELVATYTKRKKLIREISSIGLIETPVFKRPWLGRQGVYGSANRTYQEQAKDAVESWLLTRMESYFHDADRMVDAPDEAARERLQVDIRPIRARFAGGTEPRLVSIRQLAAAAQTDARWMEAATVHAGRADFDVVKLVETLVLAESVPALPADRYKDSGLRHRSEWEKTWELQRAEDAVEAEVRAQNPEAREEDLKILIRKAQQEKLGDIPVPPKYAGKDFKKPTYWKLRGKLDVPKERWVLYPGAEGGIDTSPVIAWAGWDHAQQAQALTGYYQQATDNWGWEPSKLARLLAALKDLLPWLHQWHNALDPTFGDRPCDSFQSFYDTERHTLRLTDEEIEALRMGGGA